MKESLFFTLIVAWFETIKGKIETKINGNKEAGLYLHDEVLTEEYSTDLKWDSASVDDSIVAADIVAMDSPLPLKRRGSLGKASGDIVKTGMKKTLKESDIVKLNVLNALKKVAQMVAKLFDDAPKCALGIKERVEAMFLQAISTGYTIVEDADNEGVGVRVNYGFLDVNKFCAVAKWGTVGADPFADVVRALESASSNIAVIWTSKIRYNQLRSCDGAKRLYANFKGIPVNTDSILPTPTKDQFNEAFEDEYGVTFRVIDREVVIEKDGSRKKIKPFDKDTLVFLTQQDNLGRVVYGTLAEETNPVDGVQYQKVGAYILISKYSVNEPYLMEVTASQAFVLPVIDGADDIYLLNTQEVEVPEG